MEIWIFFTILIAVFLVYFASKLLSLRKKRETEKARAREKRKERRNRAHRKKLIKEKDSFEKKSVEQTLALEKKFAAKQLVRARKLVAEKMAHREKLIAEDQQLANKIAGIRRAEKLLLAQKVIQQVDLKQLRLAVSFYGQDERDSLLLEENENLNDSYKKEIENVLGLGSLLDSEVWFDFFQEIKDLGLSLLTKLLENSFPDEHLVVKATKIVDSKEPPKPVQNPLPDETKKEP